MSKLPCVTGHEVVRAFEKAGYVIVRTRGSHHRMEKVGCRSITIPVHAADMRAGTLRALIKAAGLTVEQFRDLLAQ